MSWVETQPKNRNFLTPIGFQLELEIFPGVDFFCQSVNFPDISVPVTEVPTMWRSFPIIGGGGVSYGDLQVNFIIDEDMENYAEIFNWIRINGQSEDTAPFKIIFSKIDYSYIKYESKFNSRLPIHVPIQLVSN